MITLRNWREDDAEAVTALANNKKIFDNLRDLFPHPYSLEDAVQYIALSRNPNPNAVMFAIDLDGKLIGSIGGTIKDDIYRKNAEIGYFIGEEYWGKGYMTDAIRLMTDYLFSHYDIIRIYAEPFIDNIASRRALEKSGYIHEATLRNNVIKNGKITGSYIYSILREDYQRINK